MELASEKSNSQSSTVTLESVEGDEQREVEAILRNRIVGRRVGWSILAVSLLICLVGITLFPGTTVGFVMFFGGGVLSFEAYLLLDTIKKAGQETK